MLHCRLPGLNNLIFFYVLKIEKKKKIRIEIFSSPNLRIFEQFITSFYIYKRKKLKIKSENVTKLQANICAYNLKRRILFFRLCFTLLSM